MVVAPEMLYGLEQGLATGRQWWTCCPISLGERILFLVGHKTGLNLDLEDWIAHPLFRNRHTKAGGRNGGGSDEDLRQ